MPAAEQHKEQWHYNAPFDLKTGMPLYPADGEDYSSVTSRLSSEKDERRSDGCCDHFRNTDSTWDLLEDKRKEAGKQFVDVGIAEETAAAHCFRNRSQRREDRCMEFTVHFHTENF